MRKGRAALTYLPQTEVTVTAAGAHSIEAIKMVANKIATMQEQGTPDGSYASERCRGNNPYDIALWNIDVTLGASPEYVVEFVSEEVSEALTIGRAALSTRRPVIVGLLANGNLFSVRSLLAAINFVEKLEDKVAEDDDSAVGDDVYTDISLRGFTPYENFVWTIEKAGDTYTLTPTVNS